MCCRPAALPRAPRSRDLGLRRRGPRRPPSSVSLSDVAVWRAGGGCATGAVGCGSKAARWVGFTRGGRVPPPVAAWRRRGPSRPLPLVAVWRWRELAARLVLVVLISLAKTRRPSCSLDSAVRENGDREKGSGGKGLRLRLFCRVWAVFRPVTLLRRYRNRPASRVILTAIDRLPDSFPERIKTLRFSIIGPFPRPHRSLPID